MIFFNLIDMLTSCWFQICLRCANGQFSPTRCCEPNAEQKPVFHNYGGYCNQALGIIFIYVFLDDRLFRNECILVLCPVYSLSISGVMYVAYTTESSYLSALCTSERLTKCWFLVGQVEERYNRTSRDDLDRNMFPHA